MKILITGATGLIGRSLIYKLLQAGHEVRALARSPEKLPELPEQNVFSWSDHQVPPVEALAGCDSIIHLAGEGIADQRWTEDRKKRLWNSRIAGTENLITALESLEKNQRPKTFISGSAIGYYGEGSEVQDEDAKKGTGFLSDLCFEWENRARRAEALGLRTVILRTGLVLAKDGGVLKKSAPVVLGDGQQWMSWIHIDDMVQFIIHSLEAAKVKSGVYNLTAPNPVTNVQFTKNLASLLKVPFTTMAPAFVLKMVLGEMSAAVLANQNIVPVKTLSTGFKFKFEKIEAALSDLLSGRPSLNGHFSTKLFIPKPRSEVFPFFSKPENLESLTPPWLNFHILSKTTEMVEKNTLIEYRLNIHGIPTRWKTLISEWRPDDVFVDEQLKGPYQKWHHVHKFEDVVGGTLISDDVTFRIPGWIFGKLLTPLIRHDVNQIFSYRQKKIKEIFK